MAMYQTVLKDKNSNHSNNEPNVYKDSIDPSLFEIGNMQNQNFISSNISSATTPTTKDNIPVTASTQNDAGESIHSEKMEKVVTGGFEEESKKV